MKNIESKTDQQLEAIEDQKEKQLEIISSNTLADGPKRIEFKNKENQKSIELINGVIKMAKKNKTKKFICIHTNRKPCDFNKFRGLKQFGNDIFSGTNLIEEAKDEQDKMERLLMSLKKYNPTSKKRKDAKDEVGKNAEELFGIRDRIIRASEDGTFPLPKENLHEYYAGKEEEKKKTI